MSTTDTLFPTVLVSQFDAALAMLRDAIVLCPAAHWESPVAAYPVWMVAYHTLCFVDCYLSPSDEAFELRTTPTPAAEPGQPPRAPLHPRGRAELEEEFPSRLFTRDELLGYIDICREKLRTTLAAETPEILAGPSGFPRLRFSRAELHLYNLRHVQHHAGQLHAAVRRFTAGAADPMWVGTGWKVRPAVAAG